MTIIIRNTTYERKVVERFLFERFPIERHNIKYCFDVLNKTLNDNNVDLSNCRSESFDNTSNVSALHIVQAHFCKKN